MKTQSWIGLGIVFFILLLLYLFGVSALRAQMESAMSSACGRPVFLHAARVILPPGIRLSGIHVPALAREPASPLSIGEIQARWAVAGLLQGQGGVELEIRRPVLKMTWTPQTRALFSLAGLKGTSGPVSLPLARLRLEGGEWVLMDETVNPAVTWNLHEIEGEVSAASAPAQYRYRFSGRWVGPAQEDLGRVAVEGAWVSGGPLDGKLSMEHRDLRFFSPYLRRVLGTPPSKGRAELTTQMTIHQGVVLSRNEVTAQGVSFSTGAVTTLGLEGNRLVELLQDGEGKVHLSFIVTGRLGEKLNWSDLATGALREAMRQALTRGIQRVLKETEQTRPAEEILRDQIESLGR